MSHTEGKLQYEHRKNSCGYATELFDESGKTVATAAWYPVRVDSQTTVTNREANARRLVACWNAFLPFTTEQIEGGIDLAKLLQERNELLAVLLSSYNFLQGFGKSPEKIDLCLRIGDLLAKYQEAE